jgi:hypothetical protein
MNAVTMPALTWDANLATVAANYATTCNFNHNGARATDYSALGGTGTVGMCPEVKMKLKLGVFFPHLFLAISSLKSYHSHHLSLCIIILFFFVCLPMPCFTFCLSANALDLGENIAFGYSSGSGATNPDVDYVLSGWFEEELDWTFPRTCTAGKQCGHWTQIIWAGTLRVGCGIKRDCTTLSNSPITIPNNAKITHIVCDYGPAGNIVGQDPYVRAAPAPPVPAPQATPAPAPQATTTPPAPVPHATTPPTASPQGSQPPTVGPTTASPDSPPSANTPSSSASSLSLHGLLMAVVLALYYM